MEKAAPWRRWKISLSVDSFMQPCACRLFHQRDWEQQKKKKKKKCRSKFQLMFWSLLPHLLFSVAAHPRLWRHPNASWANSRIFPHISSDLPSILSTSATASRYTLLFTCARAPVPAGFHLQQWCRRNYVKWQQSTPFNETNVFGGAGIKTLLSVPVWNNRAGGRWISLPRMLCPQTEGAVRLLPPLLLSVLQIKRLDPLNIWRILLGKKW